MPMTPSLPWLGELKSTCKNDQPLATLVGSTYGSRLKKYVPSHHGQWGWYSMFLLQMVGARLKGCVDLIGWVVFWSVCRLVFSCSLRLTGNMWNQGKKKMGVNWGFFCFWVTMFSHVVTKWTTITPWVVLCLTNVRIGCCAVSYIYCD